LAIVIGFGETHQRLCQCADCDHDRQPQLSEIRDAKAWLTERREPQPAHYV
jgi:hypothetical protein